MIRQKSSWTDKNEPAYQVQVKSLTGQRYYYFYHKPALVLFMARLMGAKSLKWFKFIKEPEASNNTMNRIRNITSR